VIVVLVYIRQFICQASHHHNMTWGSLNEYPKAVVHIDGDAFFVSCEIARRPELRGKAVVTGAERGIASAMSAAAKRLGITRGMPIFQMRKLCPELVVLPSDYELYSLYSLRMFEIVRRFTPVVEEYSIDECFAELSGMRRVHHASYEEIARRIKHELETELGMTFGVGLAPTKVLGKVATSLAKKARVVGRGDGFLALPSRDVPGALACFPIEKVWGIGPQTAALLAGHGVKMAGQLAEKTDTWVNKVLTKPGVQIWHELRGTCIHPVCAGARPPQASIQKTKTFTPPSCDPSTIFAQLSKNVENACIKARRHGLAPSRLSFFVKTGDFRCYGHEIKLSRPSVLPSELLACIEPFFHGLLRRGETYRATGVTLSHLSGEGAGQLDLFGATLRAENVREVYKAVDEIAAKYGKHSVFLASSFWAHGSRASKRSEAMGESSTSISPKRKEPPRSAARFQGETPRRRVGLPYLGEVG